MKKRQIKKYLKFDSHTGIFTNRKTNNIIGTTGPDGVTIHFNGNKYKAEELAWYYCLGEWPKDPVIHKNGVKHDNWITNLKLKTVKRDRKDNKSFFTGVYYDKNNGKFRAQLTVQGQRFSLGTYKDINLAVIARAKAEQEHGIIESPAQDHVKNMFM